MNSKIFYSRFLNNSITRSDRNPIIAKNQIKWMYTEKGTGT